jgi:hypothetical protein
VDAIVDRTRRNVSFACRIFPSHDIVATWAPFERTTVLLFERPMGGGCEIVEEEQGNGRKRLGILRRIDTLLSKFSDPSRAADGAVEVKMRFLSWVRAPTRELHGPTRFTRGFGSNGRHPRHRRDTMSWVPATICRPMLLACRVDRGFVVRMIG